MNTLPQEILNIIIHGLDARDIVRLMSANKLIAANMRSLARPIAFPILDATQLRLIDLIVEINTKSYKKPAPERKSTGSKKAPSEGVNNRVRLLHIYNSALADNVVPIVRALAYIRKIDNAEILDMIKRRKREMLLFFSYNFRYIRYTGTNSILTLYAIRDILENRLDNLAETAFECEIPKYYMVAYLAEFDAAVRYFDNSGLAVSAWPQAFVDCGREDLFFHYIAKIDATKISPNTLLFCQSERILEYLLSVYDGQPVNVMLFRNERQRYDLVDQKYIDKINIDYITQGIGDTLSSEASMRLLNMTKCGTDRLKLLPIEYYSRDVVECAIVGAHHSAVNTYIARSGDKALQAIVKRAEQAILNTSNVVL